MRPAVFESFKNNDLLQLVEEINAIGSEKFINCYTERLLYEKTMCDTESNYEKWLHRMAPPKTM